MLATLLLFLQPVGYSVDMGEAEGTANKSTRARRASAFDRLGSLRPAEEKLRDEFRRGFEARIGETRPEQPTEDNNVRAEFIRLLALGADKGGQSYARGVELRGAWITGILDLSFDELEHRLMLRDCVIDNILAAEGHLKSLDLRGTYVRDAVSARDCRCDGAIRLGDGFRCDGGVRLPNATIGSLHCQNATLLESGGIALDCVDTTVVGSVQLAHGFTAIGSVDFGNAKIGGDFNCFKGTFGKAGGDALFLNNATIGGSLKLSEGFRAVGRVTVRDAAITGNLDCNNGTLHQSGGVALDGRGATITRNVMLGSGFTAKGSVDFGNAKIGGDLNCREGSIDRLSGDALFLNNATIGGSLKLNEFRALGRVSLGEAMITGNFDCSGSFIVGDGRDAVYCNRTRIEGSVFLDLGCRAVGCVLFYGASIGGDLSLIESSLEDPAGKAALDCRKARIKGALVFSNVTSFEGKLWLSSAEVGTLEDDAESWKHGKDHYRLDGFTYARLGGGAPTNAKIRVAWLEGQEPRRNQKLPKPQWWRRLPLLRRRRRRRPKHFDPQPWDQLGATLRAMGFPDEARTVAIAKHRKQRHAGHYIGNSRLLDLIYGGLLGYGYRPFKLLIALVGIWLFCGGAYWLAAHPERIGAETHLLAPADRSYDPACLAERATAVSSAECPKQPTRYQDFHPWIYSADVLLPVVSLDYKEEWQPVVRDAWGTPLPLGYTLQYLYWLERALGWLAGLQLVGLLGNLIKKD